MRDVDLLFHKGKWKFKALTDKGKEGLCDILNVDPAWRPHIKEVFMQTDNDHYATALHEMHKKGLVTHEGPPPWEL